MTADVYCNRLVPRSASNHETHCWFNAWQTCSNVTSGFFPPEPGRLAGGKRQGYQAQHQVPHQAHITRRFVPRPY